MEKSTKTVLGLLVAGAIGVAIGILLAPDKGSKTRSKIKDSLGGLNDKLDDFLTDVSKKGEEIISDLKERATKVKNDLNENLSKE